MTVLPRRVVIGAAIAAPASLLTGCQKEDTRAQAVLSKVDQIVIADVLDESTATGMTVRPTSIIWSAGEAWAGDELFPIPDLPLAETRVYPGRSADRPETGERAMLLLAHTAPDWKIQLVAEPDTAAIAGTSTAADNAREAVAAGMTIRGADADQLAVLIELIEGARGIEDAENGHGDPAGAGGLMKEVLPHLSQEAGGPG